MTLHKLENESFQDYHIRLYENLDIYEINTHEASELLNKEFGSNYDESKWRKDYAQYVKWKDYITSSHVGEVELDKLTTKKLELQKERNKLSAEKNEINKWIREQARTENIYEKIENAISKLSPIIVPEFKGITEESKQELIIDIADAHIGAENKVVGFNGKIIAEYNTDVFERRMWELMNRSISIIKKEKVKHVTVVNLGDFIDGLLHTNQLKFQQLGVVDQVIYASEFMANWLNKLSEYVSIDYRSVTGNHAENRPLQSNRSEFREENMERLIEWNIKTRLKDNNRVTVHKASNIIYFDVLGTKILCTHGQDEKNLEQSLKDYMMIYDVKVDIYKVGHLRHLNNKVIGMNGLQNIEYIQSPSICGINDYSVNLKKTANAGTIITVIEEGYGKINTYDIRFK